MSFVRLSIPRTRQPSPSEGSVRVKHLHPLARGLVSMAWGGYNYVNGQELASVKADLARVDSPVGVADVYSSSGGAWGYAEVVDNLPTVEGLSIHVIVNPQNLTTTNSFAAFGDISTSGRLAVLDLSGTESNDPIRVIQSGGTFGGTYYNSPPTNQWNSYTAVFNSGTNNQLYRDGLLLKPSSTNGSASANFPAIARLDHGQLSTHLGPANTLTGQLALTMHWRRRLHADEAEMLAKNPWQVLEDMDVWIPASESALPTLFAITPSLITSNGWRDAITEV